MTALQGPARPAPRRGPDLAPHATPEANIHEPRRGACSKSGCQQSGCQQSRRQQSGRHQRGQATVELSLVVPVVVVLVLMVVQVGQVVRDRVVVVHTAREVARAASVSSTPPTVAEIATRHGLDADSLTVVVDPVDAAGYVRVAISYDAGTDVVLVGPLLPTVTVTAEAHMLAEWNR